VRGCRCGGLPVRAPRRRPHTPLPLPLRRLPQRVITVMLHSSLNSVAPFPLPAALFVQPLDSAAVARPALCFVHVPTVVSGALA